MISCVFFHSVRGALLAKGPDSSIGEVHRGSCSEEIHMEEEKVEVKGQEEEVEDRETHGREQREEKGENKQSLRRMTHGWDDAHQHLSQCGITHHYACAPMRCTVYTTRRLQQMAISCKRTYCNKQKMNYSHELHQLLSQVHHEELEKEGCHFWYC